LQQSQIERERPHRPSEWLRPAKLNVGQALPPANPRPYATSGVERAPSPSLDPDAGFVRETTLSRVASGCRFVGLRHVKAPAARAAVPGNAVPPLHNGIQDAAGHGRRNVPFEAAWAAYFSGFDFHIRAHYQAAVYQNAWLCVPNPQYSRFHRYNSPDSPLVFPRPHICTSWRADPLVRGRRPVGLLAFIWC
jgi:hypothetical protein